MLKIAPDKSKKPAAPPVPSPQPPVPPDDPTQDPSVDAEGPGEDTTDPAEAGEAEPSGLGKVPQGLVVYMPSQLGPFQCDHCCFFDAPNGCSIVDGEIDPGGKCNLFCPQAVMQGMGEGASPDDSQGPPDLGAEAPPEAEPPTPPLGK